MWILRIIPESAFSIQITHCQMVFFFFWEIIKTHRHRRVFGESAEERFRQWFRWNKWFSNFIIPTCVPLKPKHTKSMLLKFVKRFYRQSKLWIFPLVASIILQNSVWIPRICSKKKKIGLIVICESYARSKNSRFLSICISLKMHVIWKNEERDIHARVHRMTWAENALKQSYRCIKSRQNG